MTSPSAGSLRDHLQYTPRELRFGTSGRRAEVVHLTQLEVYLNALGEIEYLQSLDPAHGGIRRGDPFYFACDLRPSSCSFVEEQGLRRGEIAQAIVAAITDAGMQPVNLGRIPTPALAAFALARTCGSIMITGSHIPFDRNGYKTATSRGELLKEDEAPIGEYVARVRERLYRQDWQESAFDGQGMFRDGHRELPAESADAVQCYIRRYTQFFAPGLLSGLRLVVYQHSAVGRDLLVEILERLGAAAIPAGRSDTFIPIDTEAIDQAQLAAIQAIYDQAAVQADAVVSTDGDSDRPLILGADPVSGRLRFFPGDLVGMVTAEHLGAGAVVVPITCNDAIDRGPLAALLEPRTRIGSPYVIAGMERARASGKSRICGWEANGGFLTGTDFERDGRRLTALATRDAVLPILAVLAETRRQGVGLEEIFARLPKRFGRSALLRNFPRERGIEIVRRFSPPATAVALEPFFPPDTGFAPIAHLDYTDGVRITFGNGEVVHLRPSGNADEMRFYAVADSQERADALAEAGVAEPHGILRAMAAALP